jgi:long-chain acyl-CoA synthetase
MSSEARFGISAWAAAEPERPAFMLGDETRSFAQYDERTSRLAHALAARGVGAGDRVAIMLPNGFEFFEVWGAAAKLDASVVLVNWHLKTAELSYILGDSGARLLVAHRDLREHFGPALDANRGCALLVVGEVGNDDYEAAIAATPSQAASRVLDALASPIFYTSGTTGRPKGVVHGPPDPAAAIRNMHGQIMLWGWTQDDVYILSGPAYHAGPGGFVMAALVVGAPTVILPDWDSRAWLQLVDRHRVTISFMVPAHFIRILELPADERARYDVSSLRLIVHAGAPCPIPVKRRIIDALAPGAIWELYGMSEGGATRISPDEWLARPGSVGTPWPGHEVHILDDDGNEVRPGEQGLVYVAPAGGHRFHYHEDPEKTSAAWHESWFTVGDVGYLDDDGYLFLTDRAADMVIRGGVNIYPREIEDALHEHPAVVDCAVFGVPDERLGEQLVAVVEPRAPVEPDELREFCRARLADFKVPAVVELVEELPRQPNGKVLKRMLREEHWRGRTSNIV